MVSKVRALTSLCGLRTMVETYQAPKGPCSARTVSGSGTLNTTVVILLGAWPAGGHTLLTGTVCLLTRR